VRHVAKFAQIDGNAGNALRANGTAWLDYVDQPTAHPGKQNASSSRLSTLI